MNRYRDWFEQAQRDLERAKLDVQLLDAHYIPARYPNGFPTGKPADYYNAQKAQEALDAASDILRFCEAYFTEPEQAA